MSLLTDFLDISNIEYKENIKTSVYSSIKIGGIANVIVFPKDKEELIKTVDFLYENKASYRVVGRLSNILLPDEKINAVLIKTDRMRGISYHGRDFTLAAGEKLSSHTQEWIRDGLGGYEGLVGIPGSIGGLVCSNAGAFGDEIENIIESASIYDPSSKGIVKIKRADMNFSYRDSCFRHNDYVILSVKLSLKKADSVVTLKRIMHNCIVRKSTQPDLPSLGSIFKRPDGDYASRLIEAVKLKGYTIGGAAISEKHAGFIVNKGVARARDVRELISVAKDAVFKRYSISLEEEIDIM